MEYSGDTTATTAGDATDSRKRHSSSSPTLSSTSHMNSSPPRLTSRHTAPPPIVLSPCAACKVLRRRCVDNCVLAPYFPPTDPNKFTTAHRVFGASNIIKLLQELPENQRADAVSSMVYEANARIRDPVYGCAGGIFQLQKQVDELQAQLARAQAELVSAQAQHANLVSFICMEYSMANSSGQNCQQHACNYQHAVDGPLGTSQGGTLLLDECCYSNQLDSFWEEPLWT